MIALDEDLQIKIAEDQRDTVLVAKFYGLKRAQVIEIKQQVLTRGMVTYMRRNDRWERIPNDAPIVRMWIKGDASVDALVRSQSSSGSSSSSAR